MKKLERYAGRTPEGTERRRQDAKTRVAEWRKNNPEKYREQYLRYQRNNKDRLRQQNKEWRKKNVERNRASRRDYWYRQYGITGKDRDRMIAEQNGKCAICGREEPKGALLHVDHCHATKKVRGILCSRCNHGIGHFKDSIELLLKAVDYLRRGGALLPTT